ncbi:hypothetical protein CVT26_005867 [Gymnopilus dilepis]|uniref:DUF6699 domain-containing protein n=1 Tax=Gymnopilus dilepis TaxID=231916 RepID=A0A409Y1I7_9AGAR|nr:hypothetical protein CVT26_005867 [Gymnopilus dilepis]
MPGKTFKQVRFAYKNTFHSPPPATPPPLSFSASTVPSSLGPITPPHVAHGLPGPSPFVMGTSSHSSSKLPPKSPSRYSGHVQPHYYLERNGLGWDMMDHPSMIIRKGHPISSRALREPATNPPLPFMIITTPYLPWSIKVHASNGSYVTLEDIFDATYRSLRTNISQADFNSFPSQNDQRRATRAYEQRYRRHRNARLYEEEKRSGMKRVDFLMGHSRFEGISNNGRRPEEWHLHVT